MFQVTGPRWEKARCPWNFFFFVLESERCGCQQRNAVNGKGRKGKGNQTRTAEQYLRQHHSTRRKFCCRFSELLGSALRGGDVVFYVFDINQSSLPTPFYPVLVSICVFMALSTVFRSINSPPNSPLPHSVLPVLFLPYWFYQLYISL